MNYMSSLKIKHVGTLLDVSLLKEIFQCQIYIFSLQLIFTLLQPYHSILWI